LGDRVIGSTGSLFLFGIVVAAVPLPATSLGQWRFPAAETRAIEEPESQVKSGAFLSVSAVGGCASLFDHQPDRYLSGADTTGRIKETVIAAEGGVEDRGDPMVIGASNLG
jgi:hypothetical protein